MTAPQADTAGQLLAPSPIAVELQRQAIAQPDRVALTDGDRALTIAEFEAMVAAAAGRIAAIPTKRRTGSAAGEGPAFAALPVLVDRTYRSAVALQAVIRAGRAFAPVEATLPPARIEELFFALDAPAHAVVADAAMAALLPAWVRPVRLDEAAHEPAPDDAAPEAAAPDAAALDDAAHPQPVDPEAAGFVVFTSGSAGHPKGVLQSWHALATRLASEPAPVAASAQVRPLSFAAGLGQVVRLSAGDTLHMVDVQRLAAEDLIAWLNRHEVTTVNFGASMVATLLRVAGGARLLPHVTRVNLGGEPATWDLIAPLRELVSPDVLIVSRFGATESGMVTNYRIGPDHPVEAGPLPIGIAAQSPRVHLHAVDDDESTLEMFIRDPLAIGYLGDPELTAERFFTDDAGARWWRSGDAVAVDERGRLVHRGRLDDMVKINGLRVEPREAEAAVRATPGIADAAVVVHTTPHDRVLLVAHLVVDDPALTPGAVRRDLLDRLPSHLVPSVLMRHERLPITERGKVDVAALRHTVPVPWQQHPPRKSFSEIENWIAGLVTRIVDLGEVGVDDDVWDAGLDSLGAVELCASIADAGFGELDPTDLLQHSTPALLERHLRATRPLNPSAAVVLNPAGHLPPVFAVPGAGGTALAFGSLAHALGVEQPLVVVEPRGMHQPGPVALTIEERAEHVLECIDERLGTGDRCVILGYSAGATVALEVCRRLVAAGRRAHLVLLDAAPVGRREDGAEDPVDESIQPVGVAPHQLWKKRLSVFHGGPKYYEEFRFLARAAIRQYDLRPVDVPATLIQLHDRDLAGECRRWVDLVAVHRVGGDHQTMLHPPHVAAMADAVQAVIARR